MTSDELYPSQFLKASDLDQPFVGAIERVVKETVGRAKETKAVLYLRGLSKGMILNKTNFTKVVNLTSEKNSDEWPGQVIELFASTCEFAGETVDCIRVRAPRKPPRSPRSTGVEEEFDSAELEAPKPAGL